MGRSIFLAEGLTQAKMSDIAAKAKVSTATVYAYFPSKDDLFRAIVEATAGDVEMRLRVDLKDLDGDPIETLSRAFLDRLNDHDIRALFRIMTTEGQRFPEIRTIFDTHTRLRAHKAAVALFERLALEGRFEAGVSEVAARQLLGMLEHETIVLAALQGEAYKPRPDDQIANDAAKTIWARFAINRA